MKKRTEIKQAFSHEFQALLNIDVTVEDSKIYPDLLCYKHTSLLYRAKQALKSGEIEEKYTLLKFKEHVRDCSLL